MPPPPPPLHRLQWAVDRLKLFNRLNDENKMATFPLRGMLWLMTSCRLEGQVFVDDWPEYKHACCLHSSDLYAPGTDRDLITLASSSLSNIAPFLEALYMERNWRSKQGVIGCWVEENLIQSIIQPLFQRRGQLGDDFWQSYPNRCYTGHRSENLDAYGEKEREALANPPDGLITSEMRPDEAGMLAERWPHPIPDKEAMFRWLIGFLPSPCVRDAATGRLVAWATTYSFLAPGAGYVLPEYRGKHVADAYGLRMGMHRVRPMQGFYSIRPGNDASERQVKRTMIDLEPSDVIVRWFVYTPAGQRQMNGKREVTVMKAKL